MFISNTAQLQLLQMGIVFSINYVFKQFVKCIWSFTRELNNMENRAVLEASQVTSLTPEEDNSRVLSICLSLQVLLRLSP